MDYLFLFLALLLGVVLWLNSLRARETALGISRRTCQRNGLQLLDQTVALRKVRLTWQADGIRLRRFYEFEFSEEGIGRQQGTIVLTGLTLEGIQLGETQGNREAEQSNLWVP